MHSSLPSTSRSGVLPCSVKQLTSGARPRIASLCRATPSNWRTALSGTQQDEHTGGSTSGHVNSGNGSSTHVPQSYPQPSSSSFNGNGSHSSNEGSKGAPGRGSASPVYRRPPMRASRMGGAWRKEFDPSGDTQNQGELDTLRAIEEEVAAMKREEEEEERQKEAERQQREARAAAAAARRASSSESSSSGNGNGAVAPSRFRSSWDAKEAGGGRNQEADYLYELGRSQQYNINVSHGQSADFIDSLFTGNVLGHKSDIADGSLHKYEFRSFENIVGDYYVAPRFLERVAMHVAKNAMVDIDAFDTKIRCPLILGVWGEKGMGKTFQTELALKKLGVKTVVMSAGELEHEWAGTPGKLIRERYRRAAEIRKVHGKLSCLLINDIDAGIGHFENTQVTVNNQMVVGTLMNLCDDPNHVSIGQVWRDSDFVNRVPIIVTGNDFSTLFAPLVRDGRMDKFYWKPEREDIVAILHQMYKEDGLTRGDMERLLDTFHQQPLDFFGALRAATYDNQIRTWIKEDVVGNDLHVDDSNMAALSQRLLQKDSLPQFEPVQLTLDMLLREGARLEREQAMVNSHNLAKDYLKHMKKVKGGGTVVGFGG